ncbi:MAG: nuclear transport factor 2 family protein [Candidatus Eisenbacteria bacterium]
MTDIPVLHDERRSDRIALREMMRAIADGINQRDWESLRPWLDAQVQVTMIDQVTLHGPEALFDYVESKLERYGSILTGLTVDPSLSTPAVFHGDAAVVSLHSADRFHFRTGQEILVQSTYTATMVKQGDAWKLAALHAGVNAFQNPISDQKQKLFGVGVAVAAIGGLVLGSLLGGRGD